MTFEYIRQSVFFFRQNIKILAYINLPLIALSNILLSQVYVPIDPDNFVKPSPSILLIPLLQLLMMSIYWGASIFFMQSTLGNLSLTAGQAINASMRTWFKLLLVFVITSFGFIFGFMAFIVPGVYIAIRLSIADYICIAENKNTLESLKLSWARTSEYVWLIFTGFATVIFTLFAMRLFATGLVESIVNGSSLNIIVNILFDFLNVIVMIFGFRIYCIINDEDKNNS